MTSEHQRRCLSYTGRVTPSEYTQAASFTGAPTYTMNESCGALTPAAVLEMKFPDVTVSGSPWNQPVRVVAVVPIAVDMRVRYLNDTVSDCAGVIAMSRYSIWSAWST